MAVKVDYLSKISQFTMKAGVNKPVFQLRAKYLANSQALDWIAAQTAVVIGFENGRLNENDLAFQALAFASKAEKNKPLNFEFVTRLGDKLDALRHGKPRQADIDDNLQSIWSTGINLFDRLGGEVFELDAELEDKRKKKPEATESGLSKDFQKKPAENDRQTELAAALRWSVTVGAQN